LAKNVRKGIIFLIGQDYSSYSFKDLRYASSNENLQDIYNRVEGIKGNGLFVIGGFDQVASLLGHSELDLAHLVDNNLTAVEYARFRLALTQICDTRFEYVGRLISRRVKGIFNNISSLRNFYSSRETASVRLFNFYRTLYDERLTRLRKLLDLSLCSDTIEEKMLYFGQFRMEFEKEAGNIRGIEWRRESLEEDFCRYEQFLEEREIAYDSLFAEETAKLLCENFGISKNLLEETILSEYFESKLNWGENDMVAGRRFWSFIESNKDHWLSSDAYFERVKSMYREERIKFSQLDLTNEDISLNLFGDLSLVYLSNIHEWVKVELGELIKCLCLNELGVNEHTIFLYTTTKGKGKCKMATPL